MLITSQPYALITADDWNGANPTVPDVTPTVLMFLCIFMLMRGMSSARLHSGVLLGRESRVSSTTVPILS